MDLLQIRKPSTPKYTISNLFVNGIWQCFILEDPVRDIKIPKITAIPFGRYRVVFEWSGKFNRALPTVLDVPDFKYIRFHSGTNEDDTEGCLITGKKFWAGKVWFSRKALDEFIAVLSPAAARQEEIILNIVKETA